MTTSCVTLEEIKSYLRIDHQSEDGLLEQMGKAATELAETRLKRPIIADDDISALATNIDGVPQSVKLAVLVIVAFLYENRSPTDEELRNRVLRQALLDRYIYWGPDDETA